MNKTIVLTVTLLLISVIFLCGCNEEVDDGTDLDKLELTYNYEGRWVERGACTSCKDYERCYTVTLSNNDERNLKMAIVWAGIYDASDNLERDKLLKYDNILSGESDSDLICVLNTDVGGDNEGINKPYLRFEYTLFEAEFYST
jgi:hypothetical protein